MRQALSLMAVRPMLRRPWRAVMAVLAVAASSSIGVAVMITSAGAAEAFSQAAHGVAGKAPIRLSGPTLAGGVPETMVARVASVPGVATAVPVVQALTRVYTSRGRAVLVAAFGVDCRIKDILPAARWQEAESQLDAGGRTPFRPRGVPALAPPSALLQFSCNSYRRSEAADPDGPIISQTLASSLGSDPSVLTGSGRIRLKDATAVGGLDGLFGGRVVAYPLSTAQRLFGRAGQVDDVYVRPTAGASGAGLMGRLARVAGPSIAVEPTDLSTANNGLPPYFLPMLLLFAAVAAAVGALIAGLVTSLSMEERRREMAVAIALGAPPAAVRAALMAPGALLGMTGGLLGVPLGLLAARVVAAGLSSTTEQVAGVDVSVTLGIGSMLVGVAIGGIAGFLGATFATRRLRGFDVTAELGGGAGTGGPGSAGLVSGATCVGIGLAGLGLVFMAARRGGIAAWQEPLGYLGVAVMVCGLLGAAGVISGALARPFLGLGRRLRGTLRIAVAGVTRAPRHTATVAVAVAAVVAEATVLGGLRSSITLATQSYFGPPAAGRVVVTPPPNLDQSLDRVDLTRLAALPGVASIGTETQTGVHVPGVGVVAVVTRAGVAVPNRLVAGSEPGPSLRHGEVMVGMSLARRLRLGPGGTVTLPTDAGPRPFRVGGIWLDPTNNGTSVTLSPTAFTSAWGEVPPEAVFVRPAPGVAAGSLARTVAAAHVASSADVQTPTAYLAGVTGQMQDQTAPFWALQRAAVFALFLTAVPVLFLARRRREVEMGVLHAIGLSARGGTLLSLVEAAVVAGGAALFGIAFGAVASEAVSRVANLFLGLNPPLRIVWGPDLAYAAASVAVVGAAAVLSSLRPPAPSPMPD